MQCRQIDDNRLLGGASDHDHCKLVGVGILFAVPHIRRNEDIVSRFGKDPDFLCAVVEDEFGVAAATKDRCLSVPVVMIGRHGLRRDVRLAHPQLLRADSTSTDRCETAHALCLCCLRIYLGRPDMMHSIAPRHSSCCGKIGMERVVRQLCPASDHPASRNLCIPTTRPFRQN
jgi:hypothetical protein